MTKNVEVTVELDIARRMLTVAGFTEVTKMSDNDVFKHVLDMMSEYGATMLITN